MINLRFPFSLPSFLLLLAGAEHIWKGNGKQETLFRSDHITEGKKQKLK